MIGGHDRHCPRCGAGLCRYNDDPFCWPCKKAAGYGFAWHWSDVTHEWIRIPILKLEPPWEPKPGDIVLSSVGSPRQTNQRVNWKRWAASA